MTDRPRTHDDLGWPPKDEDHPDDPEMRDRPQPEDGLVLTQREFEEYLSVVYAQLAALPDFNEGEATLAVQTAHQTMFGEEDGG